MSKKNKGKGRNKKGIKQSKFGDLNISPIEDHIYKKGILKTPFDRLGAELQRFVSWRDHGLNEVLWAAVLRANFEQRKVLGLFRRITKFARKNEATFKETFISHSALSILEEEQFDALMSPLFEEDATRDALSALLHIESLPDYAHWQRHLTNPTPDSHGHYLMRAVAICMEHQSQEATDIRWMKLMYFIIVQQRMQFPETMRERMNGYLQYPDYGDQRKIRPSIRAQELMLRAPANKNNIPSEIPLSIADKMPAPWSDQFWKECLEKSECIPGDFERPEHDNNQLYFEQFFDSYREMAEHFVGGIETTDSDPRREGAYGLTLYCLTIGMAISLNGLHSRAEGRMLLRTIVEGYITLKFLTSKDDPTIWEQFRRYGTGQAKLAFLKNIREDTVPDFINLDDLHRYANEDRWQEYLDIGIKPWAEKNLRKMAEEAGIKDFYDKYYDWSSSYVHGNWGAIRDTVFTVCLNPLHRFHRIPLIPKLDMPSVLPDMAKIINMMLDLNNQLYPPFKTRIKHPQAKADAEEAQAP